ncbi:transposase [Thermophilibacter mediterraneus]|uniref:transposase n=1 Tax=Thermophilibacter mediterraneus TaxID=1871031 RepID=UPI0009300716|nr:transposase [Thermophilibacter mediterraneus]
MATGGRVRAASGYYHVVTRGNGRQRIFEDDGDRRAFVETLGRFAAGDGVAVIAWCLMDNHVHLVLRDERAMLSATMQKTLTTYSRRFNRRERHVGHVFQARFDSRTIEDDAYLLAAVRYVHLNPQRAGICAASDYEWSSYGEYVGDVDGITDTGVVLEMVGGVEGFVRLCGDAGGGVAPYAPRTLCGSPDEVHSLAVSALADAGLATPSVVKGMRREERDLALRTLRAAGLSIREIERETGVGRGTVYNVTRGCAGS